MFCQACEIKLTMTAKYCERCGTQAVSAVKPNNQEREKETKVEKEIGVALQNPYVTPAFSLAIVAFTLGMFPYPPAWGIGTSLPMRLTILISALLSTYYSRKARQTNRMHFFQYQEEVKPKRIKLATALSAITAMIALFTLLV